MGPKLLGTAEEVLMIDHDSQMAFCNIIGCFTTHEIADLGDAVRELQRAGWRIQSLEDQGPLTFCPEHFNEEI